jgi:hypothetical protein
MTTQVTRRCIGSTRFGLEAHDAEATDFPVQPSQKDGLGRMCKPHWREYTNALRKAAVARKAADEPTPMGDPVVVDAEPEIEAPGAEAEAEAKLARRTRRAKAGVELGPEAAEDAAV